MLGTHRSPCSTNAVVGSEPAVAAPAVAALLQQRCLVARQAHGRTCSLACQRRLPRGVVVRSSSTEAVQLSPGSDAGPCSVPKAEEWELDFCSRPILDERGKKLWELIICDPDRTFEHTQYFPNNKINSTQEGASKPERCRFFRGQMQTIISTALSELNIKPVPSRRCFSLYGWLEERATAVYPQQPGYDPKASTVFSLDMEVPQELPDALRGESWYFVQLPLRDLLQELNALPKGNSFGSRFDLDLVGRGSLTPGTLIPGVCVFSRRALPMAAWTNGYELAALKADVDRACLILETGVNQRWRYGSYRRSPETSAEATAWEEAKVAVGVNNRGVHFLALQEGEESDVAGLWLLADRQPPKI